MCCDRIHSLFSPSALLGMAFSGAFVSGFSSFFGFSGVFFFVVVRGGGVELVVQIVLSFAGAFARRRSALRITLGGFRRALVSGLFRCVPVFVRSYVCWVVDHGLCLSFLQGRRTAQVSLTATLLR